MSLSGGLSAVAGTVAGSLVAEPRIRTAALVAGASGAFAGYIDDHHEPAGDRSKGLTGHLTALKEGRLTTGAMKIGIIGAGSAVASIILTTTDQGGQRGRSRVFDCAVRSVAIAAVANCINLLDLRPGRALKATALVSALLVPRAKDVAPLLAGTAGAIAGTARKDLAGVTMLGDLGANGLGGVLGTALAAHPCRGVRTLGAGMAVALILVSEKRSFSAVIDKSPVLSAIDGWGR